jgi:2-(1,2-epoxy-1,2-dihydrophenyl)acetyl-CoA isomerase
MPNGISAEQSNGLLEITLDRPDRLNSFIDDMHIELRRVLSHARKDPGCRAILITGRGRGFCAGQDLQARDPRASATPPDLQHTLANFFNPTVSLIRSIEKPVICAVNGVAAGAGANLALACDIVLAAKSARFIQSFAKVGLIPDAGGTWSLTHLIGQARAKALALTAKPLDAKTAADWGLIWQVCEDDNLMDEARSLAMELAAGATVGLGLTKLAIQSAADNSFEQQLVLEAQLQGRCGRTPDYAEGVTSFLEKRKAHFTGEEHALPTHPVDPAS